MGPIVPKNLWLSKESAHMLMLSAIVVLVAAGAFGLGRLTAVGEARGRLVIHAPDMPAALAKPVPLNPAARSDSQPSKAVSDIAHAFVASKNGSKYYASACSGASRIKPENQVWFATEGEAQAAGYTLSATCK